MSRASPEGSAARRRQHAAAFAALGDETRLALVAVLAGAETRSIVQLTGGSRLTRQAITKHLRVLENAGIVRSVRTGRESRFELDLSPVMELQEYLGRISTQWDQALAKLKALVEAPAE
jgi:DNA-binding transcriptional ArsR family regulator